MPSCCSPEVTHHTLITFLLSTLLGLPESYRLPPGALTQGLLCPILWSVRLGEHYQCERGPGTHLTLLSQPFVWDCMHVCVCGQSSDSLRGWAVCPSLLCDTPLQHLMFAGDTVQQSELRMRDSCSPVEVSPHHHYSSFTLFFFLFVLFRAEDRSQGLVLARQVLYH